MTDGEITREQYSDGSHLSARQRLWQYSSAPPVIGTALDLALSMHMLYHVPDIQRAITELRRVLLPGAPALVATNGAGHTAEAKAILAQAASRVAGLDVDPHWDTQRFDTDIAATLLAAVFAPAS